MFLLKLKLSCDTGYWVRVCIKQIKNIEDNSKNRKVSLEEHKGKCIYLVIRLAFTYSSADSNFDSISWKTWSAVAVAMQTTAIIILCICLPVPETLGMNIHIHLQRHKPRSNSPAQCHGNKHHRYRPVSVDTADDTVNAIFSRPTRTHSREVTSAKSLEEKVLNIDSALK